jgi:hypothetical protein
MGFFSGIFRSIKKIAKVAAPLIGLYVGGIAGKYLTGLGGAFGSKLFGTTIGNIVGGLAGSFVGGALAGTPSFGGGTAGGAAGGVGGDTGTISASVLLNKSSNNAPIPLVYGLRKIGGTRVFMEVSGGSNEYLHIVLAVSEGEINSFDNIYINDVLSTDSRFSGFLNIYKHTGSDTQAADSNLVSAISNWTSNHQLKGTAYLYIKLKYDQNAFASGLPTITADVKGTKVYDPRTSTTAWSDNPALCIRDYLTNTRYGRGIDASLIDDTSFNSAANHCDELVSIGVGSKKRYTCNGVVDTSLGSMDILKNLATSCRGAVIFTGGKYKLVLDKVGTASFTFSEDNIIGGWSIKLGDKANQFNRLRANFFNPDRNWQADIAVVDSTTLRAQDNGLLLEKTIEMQ